jgi:hypothetical protein
MVAVMSVRPMSLPKLPLLDCWVVSCPLPGQTVCGDVSLVKPFADGVLLAAIDGVGHGDAASVAAHTALAVLNDHPDEPVINLVRRCHAALARTRGVVMTLASLRALDESVTWLGVGNVEGRLLHAGARANHSQEAVLLRSGLVGYKLPALSASVLPLEPGDMLILATDGIHPAFAQDLQPDGAPRQLAECVLAKHFRGTDDALVLVARYLGKAHG